ncbi:MAG TPA: hypothetical protein DD827_10030, partial [Gammaproteobacteria bacterium]|nr:hypothetical protein [Gammaproteobacteria bacterium]
NGSVSRDENFEAGRELGENDIIRHIGYARYKGAEYLRVQSDTRFSVLKRSTSSDDWAKSWSSFVGGAEDYQLTPSLTTKLQHLPANSEISAEALIILGAVIVPVFETTAGGNSCSAGTGKYYLFDLANGLFPNNRFILNGALLSDSDMASPDQVGSNNPVITIGKGRVHRPQFSIFEGKMSIYGHTEESDFFKLDVNQSQTGTKSWREIR